MQRDIRYQGAIVRGHHLLLIRHQPHGPTHSYWLLPGGGRDPAESEEACVAREMREETHLEVVVERLLLDEPWTADPVYQRGKTYLCIAVSGDAQPGAEPEPDAAASYAITDVGWIDLRDPASWDPLITRDRITLPQLQRIRAALGYSDPA